MDKISNERKAQIFYQGDGTQTQYSFPFDYLRKAFIKVALVSDTVSKELTQGTEFTVTDRVVTLTKPTTLKIQIYRRTGTKPLVGWADASVLKAADMTVQSTQLLHLAEESLDMAQEKGLTTDDIDGVWDARYNRIKNLLEPTDSGDAVNLGYITKNQDSLLNKLNSTGETQNKSIVATGDAQNARLVATGEAQNTRLLNTGDTQNTRLSSTGDSQNDRLTITGNEYNAKLISTGAAQNKALTDTGNAYVSQMTPLKDTVVKKAAEVNDNVDLAKKWAIADDSPDGVEGNKSSKTWAEEAKSSVDTIAAHAAAAKASELASATSKDNAAKSANAASTYANAAYNSRVMAGTMADNAAKSATDAANSLTQLGTHEANAAASAAAAAKSAAEAAKFDPSSYYSKAEVDNKIQTVWNEPLSWEEVNTSNILNGGITIIYDSTETPRKLRYSVLFNTFKNALPFSDYLLKTDLSDYALKTYVDTKLEDYALKTSLSNYALKTELDTYVPRTELSNYALKTDVDTKLEGYALKTTIPTKTSQLTNDSSYATTTYVRSAISSARASIEANIPTKTSQLTNDSGFALISNGHLVINGSELWIE